MIRAELGLDASARLKTVNTIVEKLRRERTRLASMQDVAGLRIVIDGGLDEQNRVSKRLLALFPQARVVDRRERPSHGYRAVHIIPEVDDCLVEIQVRTHLQDLWAQATESVADLIGRDVRYGTVPDNEIGRMLVSNLMDMSEVVTGYEELISARPRKSPRQDPTGTADKMSREEWEVRARELGALIRDKLKRMVDGGF